MRRAARSTQHSPQWGSQKELRLEVRAGPVSPAMTGTAGHAPGAQGGHCRPCTCGCMGWG